MLRVDSEPEQALFEAVIVPHRSLSPGRLGVLLAAIGVICALSALLFVRLGAWPVSGFCGLALLLAAYLLRLNARGARASELIVLCGGELRIIRTDPNGVRRETVLPAAWLNVRLNDTPGRVPALLLVGRHVCEEVARSLGETEKRELARALGNALRKWRAPRFDNPQLRD